MADHHHPAGNHKPGSMDISGHEKTFAGFVTFTIRAVVVIIVLLVFTALVNG